MFGAAGVAALGAKAGFPDLAATHDEPFCFGNGAAKGRNSALTELEIVGGARGQITDIICVAVVKQKGVEHLGGLCKLRNCD
jgi:hypothetical protein